MNTQTVTAICSVCGGEGAASLQTSATSQLPGTMIRHSDPNICVANINEAADKLDDPIEFLKRHGVRQLKFAMDSQWAQVKKVHKALGLTGMYTPASRG